MEKLRQAKRKKSEVAQLNQLHHDLAVVHRGFWPSHVLYLRGLARPVYFGWEHCLSDGLHSTPPILLYEESNTRRRKNT